MCGWPGTKLHFAKQFFSYPFEQLSSMSCALLGMTFPLLQEEEFVRLNYGFGFVPKIDSQGGGSRTVCWREEVLYAPFEHRWWWVIQQNNMAAHIWARKEEAYNMFLNQY